MLCSCGRGIWRRGFRAAVPAPRHNKHKPIISLRTQNAALTLVHLSRCTSSSCCAAVAVVSGGEGSGPLYPPPNISGDCFSASEAAAAAYASAGLSPSDIHYWGLYDCFPICLIRWVCLKMSVQGHCRCPCSVPCCVRALACSDRWRDWAQDGACTTASLSASSGRFVESKHASHCICSCTSVCHACPSVRYKLVLNNDGIVGIAIHYN
jgi:hypothetical protein